MEKVAPSERFRSELDEVLAGVGDEHDPIEVVGRLGARLILQQVLEDEVTEFLGRRRYERAGETVSHRNGHEPRTIKTTSGSMALERPRVRNASKLGFESRVLGKGVTRTHALESLVISGFLRGLSTRDVEAALEEVFEEPIASKATVSRICEDTRERYRQWCRRPLEQHDIVYCFLDAIYLKLHPDDTPAEGVLVCWGVTLEGRKVLLGLALGSRESYDSWLAFGRDMIARGLRAPALVIADGAPGIWKATRELWPGALEQRCTVHALRNVTGKLPERHHQEIKTRWWKAFDDARSPADASRELQDIITDYKTSRARHPPAVPLGAPQADPNDESPRANIRGGPPANQGHRPLPRRDLGALAYLGRAGALLPRLARREDEPQNRRRDRAPTPPAA
jgi:putative transposase